MLRARSIGSNQIEIRHGNNFFLISYDTPVAALIKGEFYKTSKKWSKTTSKHINKWVGDNYAREVSQGVIDAWVGWNA